jgi:amidase
LDWKKQIMRTAPTFILAFAFILLPLGMVQGSNAKAPTRPFTLLEATIPELQAALAAGIITSRDVVASYLARIDAYDQRGPALNAISVTNANALTEAAGLDAERRAGRLRGPLHGIPMIVKDNYETAGMQTADGSRALAGWIPPDDAYLIKRLRAAGAIIIAKSNMHEFAAGILTVGSLYGATRNPYSLTRTPAVRAGEPARPLRPISRRSAWAPTPAARFASQLRTIAW